MRSSFEKFYNHSVIINLWRFWRLILVKICRIHWKLTIKQTPELFCKYLRNESSDLHEILYGGQILSWELKFKISWRSICKCARTSWNSAHLRYNVRARVYNSCARICARIFVKFKTLAHKIVIDHHIKFHGDPSFRCGDICKTILTFRLL